MIDNVQPIDYVQLYAQAIAALDRNERYWMTHEEELVQMAVNEEFQQRPLYEDLFYRYYRPATHANEGEKKSAGELYLAITKEKWNEASPRKDFLFWKIPEEGGGADV